MNEFSVKSNKFVLFCISYTEFKGNGEEGSEKTKACGRGCGNGE